MPIQKQGPWARLKVGILALFAMAILAVLIFLITGNTNIFESHVMIYTYMADAAALTTAAPVNLDGIPIGKVKAIRLSGSKDPMRLVRIEMQIPEHQLKDIPSDSLASISAANVLGTKYINIKSGKSTTTGRPGPGNSERQHRRNSGSGAAGLWRVEFGAGHQFSASTKSSGLVESGKGSIGKLLVDETLYNNLLAILGSGETAWRMP